MKNLLILFGVGSALFAGGGDLFRYQLLFDKFEREGKTWDIQMYGGFDKTKLYLYSKREDNRWQNEITFSYAMTPFWDLQGGVQIDRDKKSKAFGEIALFGLAPYWIETRVKLLFGSGGAGIDFNFEYETLFTQKLILTSSLESRWMSKSYTMQGIGVGLNFVEGGLRLRYEVKREFAPYIGVSLKRNFGATKRVDGQSESSFVWGIRFWF